MEKVWIGMQVIGRKAWIDGSPVDYEPWADGYPSYIHQDDSCVLAINEMEFADANCTSPGKHRVCMKQVEPEQNPGMLNLDWAPAVSMVSN